MAHYDCDSVVVGTIMARDVTVAGDTMLILTCTI